MERAKQFLMDYEGYVNDAETYTLFLGLVGLLGFIGLMVRFYVADREQSDKISPLILFVVVVAAVFIAFQKMDISVEINERVDEFKENQPFEEVEIEVTSVKEEEYGGYKIAYTDQQINGVDVEKEVVVKKEDVEFGESGKSSMEVRELSQDVIEFLEEKDEIDVYDMRELKEKTVKSVYIGGETNE